MNLSERLKQKAINTVFFIRHYGIVRFFQELYHRMINGYHERRLDVNTAGMITTAELGFQNQEFLFYVPMGYRHIYAMLKKISIPSSKVVFLDYGAGKGRAVIVAATFPYKRVLGVEIAEELVEIARRNLERMNHRKAEQVQLYQTDAVKFCVPQDVNLIYFYNPFKGQVLHDVVKQIYNSYNTHPRDMYVIFINDDHFEKCIAGQKWIKRIYHTNVYPDYTCGLYKIGKDSSLPL